MMLLVRSHFRFHGVVYGVLVLVCLASGRYGGLTEKHGNVDDEEGEVDEIAFAREDARRVLHIGLLSIPLYVRLTLNC